MGDPSAIRIDWFDGTLVEDTRQSSTNFADEDAPEPEPKVEKKEVERKPIGFKRLYDFSLLEPPYLNIEIAERPGFWLLLEETELKGDFIVLIVKIIAKVYKSLQPKDNSKIAGILRKKFEKVPFLKVLTDYISGLPDVRIVEKKMNMQLWNDVQSFFFDVFTLCEGLYGHGSKNPGFLQHLFELLEATELSALGVQNEHSEVISEDFYLQIKELKCHVSNKIQKPNSEPIHSTVQQNTDPNSFRNLNIFPNKEDLIGHPTMNIKPNIVNGAYPSVEDYLDLQFKLLKEDYMAPLREGLSRYVKNPSKTKHENISIHPKVRIIRNYVGNNKIGYLVDIAWSDRQSFSSVDKQRYAQSKKLMYGALVLFIANKFKTIHVASVLDSNVQLLKQGYIAVSFTSPMSEDIFKTPYMMVESEVFFEPYHRVLKVLQNTTPDDFPMKEYIVDVQPKRTPPAYLSSETIYGIIDPKTSEEVYFPVLDQDQWPSTNLFSLDDSQMEAYTLALTREFAVIQGPPGTGKTFIGTKIASTLLKNLSLEGTPMLIISYTNHALDQFLEGILNVTTNVVRLGSQSKNARMEPYTLNNWRLKAQSKYSHLYSKKKKELERLFKQMMDIQSEIEMCERDLLSYKSVKPYLKVGGKSFELCCDKEDPILDWLFSHLENSRDQSKTIPDVIDDWDKLSDDIIAESEVNNKLEICYSEENAVKEIETLRKNMSYINDVNENEIERQIMKKTFEDKIRKLRQRLEYFKKCMVDTKMNGYNSNIKSLYELEPKDRWQVYINATNAIKQELMEKMNGLLENQNTLSAELDEISTLIDSDVMTTARVVGATTSVAARRHDLLKQLRSPIVIVEEAAEVLEGHIIASLTKSCQHLILIGDHKQLRPTAATYKLAKHYNLEIFERMIRNGIHSRTLQVQRRMRPNFVELIVPTIYERLDSHPSVYEYPDVRGMKNTLYFFTHTVFEESMSKEDSWSHRNPYEARWCVSLANYLRRMKYDSQDIVILTTYNEQARVIRQYSKNYTLLDDVRITVVDNYQGEESKIVILSLVRSNKDGSIGFLSAENRICVALSRAKEGFYIFGNMNILKAASPIWDSINRKLTNQNAIGSSLSLRCEEHKTVVSINQSEELDDCIADSCYKTCK